MGCGCGKTVGSLPASGGNVQTVYVVVSGTNEDVAVFDTLNEAREYYATYSLSDPAARLVQRRVLV